MRAGRSRTARRSANSASKVMPTRRNGRDKSHTNGQRTSASRARGQHRTNRMHQPTSTSRVLMAASSKGKDRLYEQAPSRRALTWGLMGGEGHFIAGL